MLFKKIASLDIYVLKNIEKSALAMIEICKPGNTKVKRAHSNFKLRQTLQVQ